MAELLDNDYKKWISEIKSKIRSVQIKAATAVNTALIEFYWDLGKMISEKQEIAAWGSKLINQVASDLRHEFPEMKGLSSSNLKYCQRFYTFYKNEISQQLVDQFQVTANNEVKKIVTQIPWGHNILIFSKSATIAEAKFYIQQTIENTWGRESYAH